MTTRLLADAAWLGGESLAHHVLLEVEDGRFTRVEADAADPTASHITGWVLPGLVNGHSHAFHRLLRGRTQGEGGGFWDWRRRMYEVATTLDPDSYERVATAVYSEMALAGVTSVGEFHYLHHPPSGGTYADPNEMGHALVRAARAAGIRISVLDAGYLRSGPPGTEASPVLARFSDGSVGAWLERVEALRAAYRNDADVRVGLAPHSVRALSEADLQTLAGARDHSLPLHVHVSEQSAENEACLAETGATPVGLLHRVGLLGPDTTAVHATHLSDDDVGLLGSAGAGVCYCATTERDLADGIGPARALVDGGARLTVGTDSHAVVDLFEEARGIEMHERLAGGRRGVFAPAELLAAATTTGAASSGFAPAGIAVGRRADFLAVSNDSPRLAGLPASAAAVVFAATAADVSDVWVGGLKLVDAGYHRAWHAARGALAVGR